METLEVRIKKAQLISEIESTAAALLETITSKQDRDWVMYVIERVSVGRSIWVLESIRETLLYI